MNGGRGSAARGASIRLAASLGYSRPRIEKLPCSVCPFRENVARHG